MNTKKLILASSSPRRKELIQTLQLPVRVYASHVNEETEPSLNPIEIVEALSLRKAEYGAENWIAGAQESEEVKNSIVIGSDTIVVWCGRVLGKPVDKEDAFEMLQSLQGKWHEVYSGVACVDLGTGRKLVNHRMTKVKMKCLSPDQIRRYINSGEPMDKAGAYGIQGFGALIVECIEGCYYNVVGLPLSLLSDMLAELGVEVI